MNVKNVVVVVEKNKCNPASCGNYLCMRFCPRNRAGDECIIIDPDKKVGVNEELCISCGICVKKCPFNALTVVNTPKELNQAPVHRFGKNTFRLYGLPLPRTNMLVGLVGANGIGKTTALQVLSGDLKPNLGEYERKVSNEEVLSHFQGTETHQFLKDQFLGKHRIAYKPQYVEAIPKSYKGKVRDLFKKINSNYKGVAKELELENVLDTKVSNVSGGELQRIAIAACLLKKANTFFFDEPSSYLDIKQRLKTAKIIRNLKNEDNKVFIVEHDLIMLDYMTDFIHIFFGHKGAYGITSYPYSTREGINSYLRGYLQNENMRFRTKPIVYDIKGAEKSIKREVQCSWKEMIKDLGKFKLKVKAGELYSGEVIGVVGPNGIGKTTFARLLAGELSPDKGAVNEKTRISYKPQYIKPSIDVTVMSLLQKNALYQTFKHYFRHLDIEGLMERKISELSGGELQRVSVADCLTRDADLYLLDEPSAHLDVEQRIQVAKALKEITRARKKNAIVIDHDLMFIDFVSERLLVFTGEPAIHGLAKGPFSMRQGMNLFLKDLGITFRRDENSHRPRPNKEGSVKDRAQKSKGEYYYQ